MAVATGVFLRNSVEDGECRLIGELRKLWALSLIGEIGGCRVIEKANVC
jgi:hypothetical protein